MPHNNDLIKHVAQSYFPLFISELLYITQLCQRTSLTLHLVNIYGNIIPEMSVYGEKIDLIYNLLLIFVIWNSTQPRYHIAHCTYSAVSFQNVVTTNDH